MSYWDSKPLQGLSDYQHARAANTDPKIWISKDLRATPIKDLTDDHLRNIVNMLLNRIRNDLFIEAAKEIVDEIAIADHAAECYELLPVGSVVWIPGVGNFVKNDRLIWTSALSSMNQRTELNSLAIAGYSGAWLLKSNRQIVLRSQESLKLMNAHANSCYPSWDTRHAKLSVLYPEWIYLLQEITTRDIFLSGTENAEFRSWLAEQIAKNPDFLNPPKKVDSDSSGLIAAAVVGLAVATFLGLKSKPVKRALPHEIHTQRNTENQIHITT